MDVTTREAPKLREDSYGFSIPQNLGSESTNQSYMP